jgi:Xaa-Pro aminopeptidase
MTNCETPRLLMDLRLPSSFHVEKRTALKTALGDNHVALLAAGRPPHRTADANYPFFANRNFFYLTGVEQESALLLLSRRNGQDRDILFIPPADPLIERWQGKRLTIAEATAGSGLQEIGFTSFLDGILSDLLDGMEDHLFVDRQASDKQSADVLELLARLLPGVDAKDLTPDLTRLRMIKSPAEIEMMRHAIQLTGRGIEAVMAMLRPGRMEYELWSAFQNQLAMEGCLEPAFPSIIAAGENALCLHYMNPRSRVVDGDLVQIDVGAIVGGLCADISRAYPANGKFSERQRAIYNLVRACQETAFAAIKPGIKLGDINERCKETARLGLVDLGLLAEDGNVGDYYWHNVSHHLGMDVHDVADRDAPLQSGMVLTVEPGVYVPEWKIGLRIEDDVLVTEEGCAILSQDIIREPEEIEAALQNMSRSL